MGRYYRCCHILGVGIPIGLADTGALPERLGLSLFVFNQFGGQFTGPGIVAIIALATIPFQRRIDAAHTSNTDYTLPVPLQAHYCLGQAVYDWIPPAIHPLCPAYL